MCSQYTVHVSTSDLLSALSVGEARGEWSEHVFPQVFGPIVWRPEKTGVLEGARYGLIPSFSKTAHVRYATYNARLESENVGDKAARGAGAGKQLIYEKPTWRGSFGRRHCLVPMSAFYEPSYNGTWAGHMLMFRAPELLVAAGMWNQWQDPNPASRLSPLLSYAVITDDPTLQVAHAGHDRMPVFLTKKAWEFWLAAETRRPTDWVETLRSVAWRGEFEISSARKLKPGWEKRVASKKKTPSVRKAP